jgi:hypothetical protein
MAKDSRTLTPRATRASRRDEVNAVVNLREQVETERQRRIQEHQRAVKGGALRKSATVPRKLNILAEGDSWFDYPLSPDTIDWIRQRAAITPEVLNLAHFGDVSTEMLGVRQRERIVDNLRNPANGRFDALLFSAGGNDLVGDPFCLWLSDYTPGLDPAYGVNRARLAHILGVVEAAYEDLVIIRDQYAPNCVIFLHAYDYARPDGRPACPGIGPWLRPSLLLRGWQNFSLRLRVVAEVLDAFDAMLVQFESNHSRVVYVRTLATLPRKASSWANELHPTASGFRAIGDVFLVALRQHFPGRI